MQGGEGERSAPAPGYSARRRIGTPPRRRRGSGRRRKAALGPRARRRRTQRPARQGERSGRGGGCRPRTAWRAGTRWPATRSRPTTSGGGPPRRWPTAGCPASDGTPSITKTARAVGRTRRRTGEEPSLGLPLCAPFLGWSELLGDDELFPGLLFRGPGAVGVSWPLFGNRTLPAFSGARVSVAWQGDRQGALHGCVIALRRYVSELPYRYGDMPSIRYQRSIEEIAK